MSVSETIIHVPNPSSGCDTIIELEDKKREFLHKVIPAEDRKWGYDLEKKYNFRNNYDSAA